MGEAYIDCYSVGRMEEAETPKVDMKKLLEENPLNAAYLTEDDVDFEKLRVESKVVLEKAPWKFTFRGGSHTEKLSDWIYYGELEPKLVKEGVYGLLI